jgi:tetratricopeptide (TPR) repeat protein
MFGALGLQLLLAAASGDLSTLLNASARPTPCLPSAERAPDAPPGNSPHLTAWDRIRERSDSELCLKLARAQVQLLTQPLLALESARALALAWPALAEPLVLQARARTRLKAYPEAWALWQAARERHYDFRSAHALHDYAVAAAMNGQTEVALDSYRRLLTLLALWPDPLDRASIAIEAAAAALRQGPAGLDEAAGYLSGARARATSTGLRAYFVGMEALVNQRRNRAALQQPRLDAPEIWHFAALVRADGTAAYWPRIPLHEACGAAALLIEKYSQTEALELWQMHVQGLEQTGADPGWQKRAREHLNRLHASGAHTP